MVFISKQPLLKKQTCLSTWSISETSMFGKLGWGAKHLTDANYIFDQLKLNEYFWQNFELFYQIFWIKQDLSSRSEITLKPPKSHNKIPCSCTILIHCISISPLASREGTTCSFADPAFVVYSSVASFYVPFIVTLLVYAQICVVLRRRGRRTAPPRRHVLHTQGGAEAGEGHRHRKVEFNWQPKTTVQMIGLPASELWQYRNSHSWKSQESWVFLYIFPIFSENSNCTPRVGNDGSIEKVMLRFLSDTMKQLFPQ